MNNGEKRFFRTNFSKFSDDSIHKKQARSGAVFLSQLNQIRILPQFDFLSEEMKLINLIYYI